MVIVMSYPQLIWANKPGCSTAVAEIWIGENELWCVVFFDDQDKSLKIEVLPSAMENAVQVLDFKEIESILNAAKRELLAMAAKSALAG
jgi:hypothetical protein